MTAQIKELERRVNKKKLKIANFKETVTTMETDTSAQIKELERRVNKKKLKIANFKEKVATIEEKKTAAQASETNNSYLNVSNA